MKNLFTTIILIITLSTTAASQEKLISAFDPKTVNWYNLDLNDDKIVGSSVNKAYTELLINKQTKKTIIVAVIDGGVDIHHEDLKGKIWMNPNEIPNNNIDDDKNGYIDDLYGWNFLGNSKGEDVIDENLEYTRIYKLNGSDKNFEMAKALYLAEYSKRTKEKENLTRLYEKYKGAQSVIKEKTGKEVFKLEDLNSISSQDPSVIEAINYLKQKFENGLTEKSLLRRINRNKEYLDKYLNVNFNPRLLIGDDPNNITDKNYGNSNVIGPRASHGTCLAGIIAGIRNNGIGIDGIATDVKIMVLRTTPNGDERDKDVALAIMYAVENGAHIINMSFGKDLSPQQNFIDEAIKLAESKNVLLIHAAGNKGESIDEFVHYPSDIYSNNVEATNFLNIGASSKENNENLACIFSNYGKNHVDIFAPGDDIISLDTNNTYSMHSGTSEAAPVVAGVAALILSYYPDLTPQQIISVLLNSALDLKKQKVMIPDLKNEEREKIKFAELSKCGGVVNAYFALKLAEANSSLKK